MKKGKISRKGEERKREGNIVFDRINEDNRASFCIKKKIYE